MSILINNAINAKLRSIAAAALAAGALVSVPAQAKELAVVKPTEIFAAYQVICLANPGDLDAQIAAAKAAPYNFTLAETSEDGSQRFDNPRMFAAMRKDAKNHFCMVGGRLAEGTSIDAASAAGASVLFHAVWNHASDGGESFFLVPTSGTTIPEPRSLLIFGAGLLGLAALGQLYRRRRVEV